MDGHRWTATIMKALGHPVRLQILDVLREEDACVCHLEYVLGQRQAYISQQLSRLREAGLVIDRREGLNIFYALSDESIGPLLDEARAAAAALTGEALAFREPVPDDRAGCPCPKCHEKVEHEKHERQTSSAV